MNHLRSSLLPGLMACLLTACNHQAPPCPHTNTATPAASAGCVVTHNNQLLVVIDQSGKLSIPGGSSEEGEAAQCTAHRETWEETGLDIRPGQRLQVFDNGFHLFRCHLHADSGQIDPPLRLEIQRAFWLAPEQFAQYEWRYPNQQLLMAQWLSENE